MLLYLKYQSCPTCRNTKITGAAEDKYNYRLLANVMLDICRKFRIQG